MQGRYISKDMNELKLKIAKVFDENIQMLSSELREMLLDDLVTAFENRSEVFNKAQTHVQVEIAESFDCETVQT
jgi:hypothetical protein